jgi:tRNA pseudouridine38-40 synthase
VTQEAADRVRIDVCGSGFLWNMVRIIAGTLVEIGRGRMQGEAIPAIIASGKREEAGPTLPPTGLRLEWIKFGEQLASSDDDE